MIPENKGQQEVNSCHDIISSLSGNCYSLLLETGCSVCPPWRLLDGQEPDEELWECSFIFGKKPITSLNWQVHMWFTMPTAWYNEREHGSHMWRSTFNVTVFIQLYLHLYRLFSMWEFFFFVSFVEKANHEWKCDDVHHFLFMLKFQLTCNTCLILWFSYVKRNIRHFRFDVLFLQYLKFWVTCKKKQKQVHLQFMWKTENITHGQSNCQTINWQSFVNTSHVTLFSFHMWYICSVHSVFKPVSDWLVLETC